jgi:hypothetical protein
MCKLSNFSFIKDSFSWSHVRIASISSNKQKRENGNETIQFFGCYFVDLYYPVIEISFIISKLI